MKHSIAFSALAACLALSACDRPTVVNTPPSTVAVPVPTPGPPGAPGSAGQSGAPGAPGQPGGGTTVIVTPPASAASN
jgi:hypothetical protein